jgi:subtilase family serine protease
MAKMALRLRLSGLMLALTVAFAAAKVSYGQEEEFHEEHPAWTMPDLAIDRVTIDPERAEPGAAIRFTTVVTNEGPGDAPTARLHLSMRGREIASVEVPPLASGVSTHVGATWTAQEPGIFPVLAELVH